MPIFQEGSWNVFSENYDLKFVVDSDDAVRESIGISREMFGLLEKRDSYLIDSKVIELWLDTKETSLYPQAAYA